MDFSVNDEGNRPGKSQEPLIVNESPVEQTRLGLPPSVLAGMACVIPFLGGIGLGIAEKSQRFVVLYALQSLLFWIVAAVFFWFSGLIFAGDSLGARLLQLVMLIPIWLVGFFLLGTLIVMSIKAFHGVEWHFPGLRNPLEQLLDRLCPVGS